jgi:hypothetical protein
MAGITIPFEGAAHKDYRELIYSTTVQPGAALVDICASLRSKSSARAARLAVLSLPMARGTFSARFR